MKKRFLVLVSILFLQSYMFLAWASPGSWRSHLAYHNATQCVAVDGKVYVVSDGSLYSYAQEDGFVECYDKTNGLSNGNISHIAVCEESKTLVIIYKNACIDLMHSDGSIVTIIDLANEISLDPKVNSVNIINGKAYLATNFGVLVLDVLREEFGDTYMFDKVANSCVSLDDAIYVSTVDGLYRGDVSKNLLDMSNWELLGDGVYAQLQVFDKLLLALDLQGTVHSIDVVAGTPTVFCQGDISFMHYVDGKLLVGNKTDVYVYAESSNCAQLTFDGTVNSLTIDNGVYWTCNGSKGLNGYQYDQKNNKLVKKITEIIPNSPVRNYCQYLSFVDDGRLLVAGGCLNYYDKTFYAGTLMMYEDGVWSSFEENIASRTAGRYRNMTSIVQDPKDPNHHFASSFGQGIYEFRNMKFVKQYTHKEYKNKTGLKDVVASPLESAVPSKDEYTRISRLQYDKQGNMWISNADGGGLVSSPLKIMKPDGKIVSLYYEQLKGRPTVTEVLFASNGWVWVVSMRAEPELFCIDMNGTLENTKDDRIRVFDYQFMDQDANLEIVALINDIAEDANGDIWLMTDRGPYVLYNVEKVFEEDYRFTKIKVPRNDGTNYADYLLENVWTTCIEIDAADRKWIGTFSNGLYLVSPDGLETIHHFTAEDTPLPSNAIDGLALNHLTGELFIGTDAGLVSYASDATQGIEEFDKDKAYAYPNPVASYYDGLITIVGLKTNSYVKIVNTAGRLVAEGTSLGGSFTWDGRTPQGQRVSTGVYYVMGCDEEGREGVVTKVLFVK